jgi:hypothetical protein
MPAQRQLTQFNARLLRLAGGDVTAIGMVQRRFSAYLRRTLVHYRDLSDGLCGFGFR